MDRHSNPGRIFFFLFKALIWTNLVASVCYGYMFVVENVLGKPYSWQFTEMLINYQGGPTRRGLVGEIIYQISAATEVQPQYVFVPLCLAFAAFAIGFLVVQMRRRGIEWWIATTSLLFATCYECLFRKDFIIFTIFIGILYLYRSRLGNWQRILAIALLSTLALIVYEPAFFIFVPVLALLLWRDGRLDGQRWMAAAYAVLMVAEMGWQLTLIGSEAKAVAINGSWYALFPDLIDPHPTSSISAIAWSLRDSLEFNGSVLLDPLSTYTLWLVFLLPLSLYIYSRYIYVAVRPGTKLLVGRSAWLLLLVLQMMSLAPLWLGLSCDFGRMCMYVFYTSMCVCLIVPRSDVERLFPQSLLTVAERVNRGVDRALPCNLGVMCVLLCVVGVPFARVSWPLIFKSTVIGKLQSLKWTVNTLIYNLIH